MEIAAFSAHFLVDLYVHQTGISPFLISKSMDIPKNIHIVYHSWEHYSSTRQYEMKNLKEESKALSD